MQMSSGSSDDDSIVGKDVLFGVHWNSNGVLQAIFRAVTSAGFFFDNSGRRKLTFTRKE
jgi:hypothetical protein